MILWSPLSRASWSLLDNPYHSFCSWTDCKYSIISRIFMALYVLRLIFFLMQSDSSILNMNYTIRRIICLLFRAKTSLRESIHIMVDLEIRNDKLYYVTSNIALHYEWDIYLSSINANTNYGSNCIGTRLPTGIIFDT